MQFRNIKRPNFLRIIHYTYAVTIDLRSTFFIVVFLNHYIIVCFNIFTQPLFLLLIYDIFLCNLSSARWRLFSDDLQIFQWRRRRSVGVLSAESAPYPASCPVSGRHGYDDQNWRVGVTQRTTQQVIIVNNTINWRSLKIMHQPCSTLSSNKIYINITNK